MKKSFSPFKRLSAAKHSISPFLLFMMMTGASCSSHMPNSTDPGMVTRESTSPEAEKKSKLISIVDPVKENWIEIRSSNNPSASAFVLMNARSCIDQKFSFRTTLHVLGVGYDMVLEEDAGHISVVTIEDSESKVTGFVMPQEIKQTACESMRGYRGNFLVVSEESLAPLRAVVKDVMVKMIPDCQAIEVVGQTAKCTLDSLLPQPALVKTEDFQKSMIRKWSRQPYILARRTGVVATLAKTATYMSNDEGFAKFCKILQFSLPEELPVVMTSRRWQNALCSGQGDLRRQAALYGLAKGTQELAMLRELYEGISRVGVLSVRIPSDVIPGRAEDTSRQPLRVTISPDNEVSDRLVAEARKYLGRSDRDDQPKRLARRVARKKGHRQTDVKPKHVTVAPIVAAARSDMCWHPLFAESWGLMRIADGMKLTGEGFNFECGFIYEHEDDENKEVASLSRYLQQSLSSETEFVLDNGQSKLLRLPHGKYQYKVHVLPPNPLDSEDVDEENTPTTSGEIAWGSSRNLSIKQW